MFDWYKIFNLTEFYEADLVSKVYTVFLTGVGQKDILVTQGNTTGVTYEDTFLPLNFNDEKNPYQRNKYAVFVDDNNDVWLGIEVPT
jgi:hypothetical protein